MADEYIRYKVKRDDILLDIAGRYKTSMDKILKANPEIKNPDLIKPGDVIKIPVTEALKRSRAMLFKGKTKDYEIKPGENLTWIADDHNISLDLLLSANPKIVNPDLVKPGDIIKIPVVKTPEVKPAPVEESGIKGDASEKTVPKRVKITCNHISYNDRFGKNIALTFDDGPNPDNTPKILDILKDYNIKAVFFVVGEMAERNPRLTRRIVNEGHILGNHTYSHPDMDKVTREELEEELIKTQKAVNKALGYEYKMTKFRPPGGRYNEVVLNAAESSGLTEIVLWTVNSFDWENPGKELMTKNVADGVAKKGGVVLFHDLQPFCLECLADILDKLQENEYKFVTVDDLLKMKYKGKKETAKGEKAGK
ncbi:MAG: polysaccharide deacetylase family protein [Armatimonadota bacterium]